MLTAQPWPNCMLQRIEIERFKSLVDVTLELGRVNVFIGANGSGKSNALEAIGLLGAAMSGRIDEESLTRRGVRPGDDRLYKSAFPKMSNVPHIALGAASSEAHYEVTLWNPGSKPTWRFKTEMLSGRGKKWVSFSPAGSSTSNPPPSQEQGLAAAVAIPDSDPAATLRAALREFAIYEPNTPMLRGMVADPQRRQPLGLSGGALAEAIAELSLFQGLEEAMDLIGWASGIETTDPIVGVSSGTLQFKDRFMAADRVLSSRDASEGALHVLFCMALALHPNAPKVLALDNLGQALNPRLANRLMEAVCKWTKQGDRQWLVTSHQPALLDGLPLQDEGVRLFAVERTAAGHTAIRKIPIQELLARRPSDEWTLSRMWSAGLLGAVPDV